MMWTRKDLKQRAKDALKRNYWKIVLVSVLSMTLGGGLSYSMSSSSGRSSVVVSDVVTVDEANDVDYDEECETGYDNEIYDEEGIVEESQGADKITDGGADEVPRDMDVRAKFAIIVFVLVLALAIFAFVFALIELLYNPFYVGVQRFMLKSVDDKAQVKEIVFGFDHSYKNVVKTMFQRDIKVLLWTLLLFIPGIYKNYQYRMVPYILAERPDMDCKEALRMSKDMMDGEKWHAFVLDMSFIPWHMLSIITCGIVGIFYAAPYVELTNAALYRRLEDRKQVEGKAGMEDGI